MWHPYLKKQILVDYEGEGDDGQRVQLLVYIGAFYNTVSGHCQLILTDRKMK